jgi:hypothetical protein
MSPTKAPDSKTVVLLFVAGAGLVVATFTYAFVRRWPTFDPLVTAGIVGVGLLLIVIYERLGHMHTELRTIAYHLERMSGEPTNDRTTGAKEASRDAK